MEGMMKRTILIIAFVISVVLLAMGLLFLCATTREPGRLPLSLILLVIGGGLAAWSALTWRREQRLEPERLADSIIDLARTSGGAEVSLAQIVAELNVPTEAAQRALGVLERRGECRRERRAGKDLYVFPGLVERKVVRRCAYCGSEFSVKKPLHKCPNCGGELELVRE
jgi:predicted Zn-ribbon and HTH transcriptional regulator